MRERVKITVGVLRYKIYVCLFGCILFNPSLLALTVGSNTAVSRNASTTFSSTGNLMRGFALFEGGFKFQDVLTTSSFDALFPVSGTVDMNGGGLFLQQDMVFANSLLMPSGGYVSGAGHAMKFPCSPSTLYLGKYASDFAAWMSMVPLATSAITYSQVMSLDWSYDNRYLAVVTLDENSGVSPMNELKIYYFDGTNLVLKDSTSVTRANPTRKKGYTVRWHPSAYFLAVGRSQVTGNDLTPANKEVLIYKFNLPSETLSNTDGKAIGDDVVALAWHPSGNYLVATSVLTTKGIILYSFSSVLGTVAEIISYALSVNNRPQQDALAWNGAGDRIALGYAQNASANELEVFSFNGVNSLALVSGFNVAQTVRGLDWSKSGPYIAVGLGTGATDRLKVYQYNSLTNIITQFESYSIASAKPIYSVHFDDDGVCLLVGLDSDGTAKEIQMYLFNPSLATNKLTLAIEFDSSFDALSVRWQRNNAGYIAVGLASNASGAANGNVASSGLVSLYRAVSAGEIGKFTFDNTKLSFDSDFVFLGPVEFNGNCTLDGGGNILDLTSYGYLDIHAQSTLSLRNLFIKGIGSRTGQLTFDHPSTSQLRLENVYIDFTNDLTFDKGSIYVEGPTTFLVKENDVTINTQAFLTVDSVTLWRDRVGASTTGNVLLGSPQSNFFLSKNSGRVKEWADSQLAIDDSNAIISIGSNITGVNTSISGINTSISGINSTLGTVNTLSVNNSNAIVSHGNSISGINSALGTVNTLLVNNSNSIVSNANSISGINTSISGINTSILGINAAAAILTGLVVQNSNVIVGIDQDLGEVTTLAVDNSNAIVGLAQDDVLDSALLFANSNAINTWAALTRATSDAMITVNALTINNSNAIVEIEQDVEDVTALAVNNSNAIIGLDASVDSINTSIADINTSIATINGSAAILTTLVVQNSNAIVDIDQELGDVTTLVINNSNAIVGIEEDLGEITTSITGMNTSISGINMSISGINAAAAILTSLVVQNSNAVVGIDQELGGVTTLAMNNSNAIVEIDNDLSEVTTLAVDNSNVIVGIDQELGDVTTLAMNNSNAIVRLAQDDALDSALLFASSNAITTWAALTRETSDALIVVNELAINSSNAIVEIGNDLSEVTTLVVDNSNVIVSIEEDLGEITTSLTTVTNLATNNSNAIVGLAQDDALDSALLFASSNAITTWAALTRATSDALIVVNELAINNSNAIVDMDHDLSEVTTLVVNNSNAIIEIDEDLGEVTTLVIGTSNAIVGIKEDLGEITTSLTTMTNLVINNSNAIVEIDQELENVTTLATDNSNAIVALEPYDTLDSSLVLANSNAIATWAALTRETSDAMIIVNQLAVNNSNAIVEIDESVGHINTSIIDINTSMSSFNTSIVVSNAATALLTTLVVQNSNAIVEIEQDLEKITIVNNLAIDNSNAIVNISDGLCDCDLIIDTSNAVVSLSACGSPCDNIILGDSSSGETQLSHSLFVQPGQMIHVQEDVCLDGYGSTLIFGQPDHAQIIVERGKTLTLRNINLTRLNNNTFDLQQGAAIKIDTNVVFEMSEDITFSRGQLILTTDCSGETLNTFFLRSERGTKRLILKPDVSRNSLSQRGTRNIKLVDLQSYTMALQNVELIGLEYISHSSQVINDVTIVGALGLSGSAIVNISKNTDMNFVVEHLDNQLRILTNDITFSGTLLFGDFEDNQVLFDFALLKPLIGKSQNSFPTVNFGPDFALLTSAYGRALVKFNDYAVNVVNQGPNSFVLGERSLLDGHILKILNFPLKQVAGSVSFETGLVLLSDQSNAIDLSFVRSAYKSAQSDDRPITMLHMHRACQRYTAQAITPTILTKDLPPSLLLHDQPEDDNYDKEMIIDAYCTRNRELRDALFANDDERELTRTPELPAMVDVEYRGQKIKLQSAQGNIYLQTQAEASDFGIHPFAALNLTMFDGSSLVQGDQDVLLKSGDILNVSGNDNTIIVTKTFTIKGKILFDERASTVNELVFQFSDKADNPTVIWDNTTEPLELGPNTRLVFQGTGTVKFSSGMEIHFSTKAGATNPVLVLSDYAVCTPLMSTQSTSLPLLMSGNGSVLIRNNAMLKASAGTHLVFGNSFADTFDISLQGGRLAADALDDMTHVGRISFKAATYTLTVDKQGVLSADRGGIIEFNAVAGVPSYGFLQKLTFTDRGLLEVLPGGRLVYAINYDAQPRMQQLTTHLTNSAGRLTGGGILQLVYRRSSDGSIDDTFAGKLQATSSVFEGAYNALQVAGTLDRTFDGIDLTAEAFVRTYINTVPNLKVSTVFIGEDGATRLRLKSGVVVLLKRGDRVVSDDEATGRVSGINGTTPFQYDNKGARS